MLLESAFCWFFAQLAHVYKVDTGCQILCNGAGGQGRPALQGGG